jgi:hypothetical protein
VDKSALFQKIVETEKATRAEMAAKFAVEKVALEEAMYRLADCFIDVKSHAK